MVAIHGTTDRMSAVNMPMVRDDLVATLEEALRLQQQLVADARDDNVPVADLVAQVTVLERLDDRRDELIGKLRRTASAGIRATQPGPPIREVVLETLTDLRWPQNAGFLEEYLWAKRQLQLDSRAFAPLRRDERRAWERAPGSRAAYIVPALNPDGSANPRWLSSSGWQLERRVIASPETERLLDLQKIVALRVRGSRGPLGTLLERYARQVLTIEPPPVSATAAQTTAWRARVRGHTITLIEQIRETDDPDRSRIARRLARLPDQAQLWGSGLAGMPGEERERPGVELRHVLVDGGVRAVLEDDQLRVLDPLGERPGEPRRARRVVPAERDLRRCLDEAEHPGGVVREHGVGLAQELVH